MLGKYAARIARLPHAAKAALREDLELPAPPVGLLAALEGCGLCSADVVLVLLQRQLLAAAAAVAGCPIRRLPPAMPPRVPKPVARPASRTGTQRRAVYLQAPNPAKPGSRAQGLYARVLAAAPLTVERMLALGLNTRDLREWQAKGWLRLEQAADGSVGALRAVMRMCGCSQIDRSTWRHTDSGNLFIVNEGGWKRYNAGGGLIAHGHTAARLQSHFDRSGVLT